MSKLAIRNALMGWVAMMFLAGVVQMLPEKVPTWSLPTNAGATGSLLDLGGRPIGVLLYSSKVACGAHTAALAEAVRVHEMLKESPRYSVKVVYGEATEEGARTLAARFPDVPILLDPAKKLASELDFDSYAVVLYRPNGRIIELAKERQVMARPDLLELLDSKSK